MTYSHDQVVGCIVAGAIGDVIGGVPERKRLSLSDDTQLTLATCEAIISAGSALPESIASSFLRWFRAHALTGLGSATLKALRDLDAGAHWALAGARGEMAAGNGAAMRIAPLAFVLDPLTSSNRVTIRDVCRITHHSDEAYIGALAILVSLRLPDEVTPPALLHIAGVLPDSRVRDRLIAFSELPAGASLSFVSERFGSSGYVVDTVPLALLAASRMTASSFESILRELVQAGGDTDTIGAIAGQLAGARLGYDNLPSHLVALPQVQSVLATAEAFSRSVRGGA